MNLNIQGHHIDITDALRNFISGKIERLSRHMDDLIDVNVILSVNKHEHKAEARIHVSGADMFAECIEQDMYVAIDGLIDKLDRQINKHNGKRHDHHQQEAHKSGLSLQQ